MSLSKTARSEERAEHESSASSEERDDMSGGRILGIDYGTRRVGIALSDPLRIIAGGVGTLANDAFLMDRLVDVVRSQEVVRVVVGMPYAPDGGKGAKASEVEAFIEDLRRHLRVAIDTWDESYTSVNAHRAFIETGMKRKKRRQKSRVDEMAARLMLQEYLNYHDTRRNDDRAGS
jgi:putative holliday junction resolvase